ncbi:unnamed protein product [Spirodela intermedia]|uniref:Malectin-like domain-containing protein n=1 Tax=Spirodela intermedia TaxID=51605 RepID=A0A7I8IJU1_SPIIN|nr:unnamed protein product [Spirodela intermedia]CAA6658155.1 unnamed protein product [Spirodela intermedia]
MPHLHLLLVRPPLALLLFLVASTTTTRFCGAAREPFALRVSCGARDDIRTPPANTLWHKDFAYTGGRVGNVSHPSPNAPPLKTLRYFPLSDGPRTAITSATFHWGTIRSGWSTIAEESFVEALIFATDSLVSCCFHSTGHGTLQYFPSKFFKLMRVRTTSVNRGEGNGSQDFDQSISTENKISGASIAPNFYPEKLYQSAIVSSDSHSQMSFQMEVDPNKNYSLWLHFAEIDPVVTRQGQRVFDILINDDIAFKNVDIVRMTGKPNTVLVLNKTVAVRGRTLTIAFHPAKGSLAIINAIEVFEVIPAEFKTLTEEVGALEILKNALGLPLRFGWNGDPCVPQQHPWSGVDCQFDRRSAKWVIDGLGLDNQGLRGFLPRGYLNCVICRPCKNLSGNAIHGPIPDSLGRVSALETLDLSYNVLNGSIPETLGQLKRLRILNLNGNFLSGRVPASLGGRPLHRASFNFTGNGGLCGIPGLPSCGPHLSSVAKIGIALGSVLAFLLLGTCLICWRKRRQNILRAQRIATNTCHSGFLILGLLVNLALFNLIAAREASYAKARTQSSRDLQMGKQQRIQEPFRNSVNSGLT